jgi:hypothetical protein
MSKSASVKRLAGFVAAYLILVASCAAPPPPSRTLLTETPAPFVSPTPTLKPTRTPTRTRTATPVPTEDATATPEDTSTPTVTATATSPFTSARTATATATKEPTATATLTATEPPPTSTSTATATVVATVAPYPDAPFCEIGQAHNNSAFHALWNAEEGCHYDHEHGQDPFTPDVADAFPGFDLRALLGGVGVGHTNPSSGMENTHKHGGFKWSVNLTHLSGCTPFEGAANGVDASAILFHGFGNYDVELEGSVHSTVALLRFCTPDGPGYAFINQHITYGQVVVPYQGPFVAPYPHRPDPGYGAGFGPYISVDCVGPVIQCRPSLAFIRDRNLDANSYWTAKNTGSGTRPPNSILFRPFFRLRDAYQVFDWLDDSHPFTYLWVCGGAVYNPAGCEYNNSTTQIHEISGVVPVSWDGLANWDTNPGVGLVSAEGFVTRYGTRNPGCTVAGEDCHPIVLVNVPTGSYGSLVVNYPANKLPANIVPMLPERDLYWCNGVLCEEGDAGAEPSGWIGAGN